MNGWNELDDFLPELFQQQDFFGGTLSKVRHKGTIPYQKVSLRPLYLKGMLHYQITYHYQQKEIHENLEPKSAQDLISRLLQTVFRQAHFFTSEADWQVLISKKGTSKTIKHPPSRKAKNLVFDHDRPKEYVLQEGVAYPFLVELGVMNSAGKVLAKRYHKFRQLNKYLEIVANSLPHLSVEKERPLTIIDFGSGKAYLTFALYHYLVEELKLNVKIVGLDLKEDVVVFCQQMADKLKYTNLHFYHQDIRDFKTDNPVDMVVSLHACDVATDYALAQAVSWQTKVILAVPCCQHELFNQIKQQTQKALLEHGIIKERLASLLTDALRAKLLEREGYQVQIMEFIDLEHTPKNILLRAVWHNQGPNLQSGQEYEAMQDFWQVQPTLEHLLKK